jgi:hypothetical protein
VQPGRQADVDQVHRQVGDQPVQIGGGGEPELAADRGELVRGAAEDDHLVHVGPLGVDGGVGLAETGAQQRDLHDGRSFPGGQAQAATRPRRCDQVGRPGHHVKCHHRQCPSSDGPAVRLGVSGAANAVTATRGERGEKAAG